MIKIKSKDENIRQDAYKAIFDEYNKVTELIPKLKNMIPSLVDIIPILSEYYGCNVIVHESRGVDYIIYSHPDKRNYKHDWPKVDLHQDVNSDESEGHVSLINPNPYAYVR